MTEPSWNWKPLLHEVATGSLDEGVDALSYLAHARNHGFQFQPTSTAADNHNLFQWRSQRDPLKFINQLLINGY